MNDKREDGGAAFPHPGSLNEYGSVAVFTERGMSLRDWFAGQAVAAILANGDISAIASRLNVSRADFHASVTRTAYEIADAMLAERAK